jgi:phosphate transport system substrate-binding protein
MRDILQSDPFSIEYQWKSQAARLGQVDVSGNCGLISPVDAFSIKAVDAVMGAQMYFYSNPKTVTDVGRQFAEFVASDRASAGLAEVGLLGKEIGRMPLSQLCNAPDTTGLEAGTAAQIAAQIDFWDRLTVTFRLDDAEQALGPAAQADLSRLVTYLAALPAGSETAVVGFTAAADDFDTSLTALNAMAKTHRNRACRACQ